jgi:hypothetical protein
VSGIRYGRILSAMYVQHSVHIDHSVQECAAALSRAPRTWFPRLTEDSATAVGLKIAGISLRKRVSIDLGEPVSEGEWTNVPVSWKATFPEQLFPVMTGKIELAPVDKNVTRLTVSGMYEPPLGRFGALLDEAVMHSVAEATVKEVTESIAKQLAAVA